MAAPLIVPTPNASPSQPRGGLATLAVFLLMIGIVVVGAFAQGAVANQPPQPVTVASGVVVTPLDEWEFGGRSDDGRTILLSQGSGSLAITVLDQSDPEAGLAELRDEWLATEAVAAGDIARVEDVRVDQPVFRFPYSGNFDDIATTVEGEVTGIGGSGVAVLFDGWAGFGDYVSVSDEIATMIRNAVIP
ncbi:MAG: hypothetical protein ABIP53_03720 [Candidatus Limnocylindrales bacterium]